jgi:hypothetical protein
MFTGNFNFWGQHPAKTRIALPAPPANVCRSEHYESGSRWHGISAHVPGLLRVPLICEVVLELDPKLVDCCALSSFSVLHQRHGTAASALASCSILSSVSIFVHIRKWVSCVVDPLQSMR